MTALDQPEGKRASVVWELGPSLTVAADFNLTDIATPLLLATNVADASMDLFGPSVDPFGPSVDPFGLSLSKPLTGTSTSSVRTEV